MIVYLLGGPYHGDVLPAKHGASVMREVTAKTHRGIITFLCYYRSTGMIDGENRLIYKYDDETAQFVRFKNAENIDQHDRSILTEIHHSFASRFVSIFDKVKILARRDPGLLKAIRNNEVGECKVEYVKDIFLYITEEDAKKIRKYDSSK